MIRKTKKAIYNDNKTVLKTYHYYDLSMNS
jgi:hypothetical protein